MNYTYFWNGPFSQWYPSPFKVGSTRYNCAEQFMMYTKALVMKDNETAEKIMNTSSPKEQKKLGREIKNFNPNLWDICKEDIVTIGSFHKYEQNPELLELLLATKPTLLVEASPYDGIWGIKLDEENAKKTDPKDWPGLNLLGKILTRIRDEVNWNNIDNNTLLKEEISYCCAIGLAPG